MTDGCRSTLAGRPVLGCWPLRDGDAGVAQTIALMRTLARRSTTAPQVVAIAQRMPSWWHLRQWLAQRVRFEHDPPGAEMVTDPVAMIEQIERHGAASGDCDDIATLAATVGLAMGLPARLVTVAFPPRPDYTHVWAELWSDGRWQDMDTTRDAQGFPPEGPSRSRIWSV